MFELPLIYFISHVKVSSAHERPVLSMHFARIFVVTKLTVDASLLLEPLSCRLMSTNLLGFKVEINAWQIRSLQFRRSPRASKPIQCVFHLLSLCPAESPSAPSSLQSRSTFCPSSTPPSPPPSRTAPTTPVAS